MNDETRKDEPPTPEEEKTAHLSDEDLAGVSGGTGNDRPSHSDISISKQVDVASPKL